MKKNFEKLEIQAAEVLGNVAREVNFDKKVTEVYYREDYMDFLVIIDEKAHCQVRQKLIKDFIADPQNEDVINEIGFLLEHAALFEEWEDEETMATGDGKSGGKREDATPGGKDKGGIVVDDSADYDF